METQTHLKQIYNRGVELDALLFITSNSTEKNLIHLGKKIKESLICDLSLHYYMDNKKEKWKLAIHIHIQKKDFENSQKFLISFINKDIISFLNNDLRNKLILEIKINGED